MEGKCRNFHNAQIIPDNNEGFKWDFFFHDQDKIAVTKGSIFQYFPIGDKDMIEIGILKKILELYIGATYEYNLLLNQAKIF